MAGYSLGYRVLLGHTEDLSRHVAGTAFFAGAYITAHILPMALEDDGTKTQMGHTRSP